MKEKKAIEPDAHKDFLRELAILRIQDLVDALMETMQGSD